MKHHTYSKLLVIAAALHAGSGVSLAQEPASTPIPISDVPQLRAILFDSAIKQEQRDNAARRLLARPDPDARTALRDALARNQPSVVQLAAARALAESPTPDPVLIAPLFALIEPNSPKPLIDASAMALGAFKDNSEVLDRLLGIARDGSDMNMRLAAIRSAGTFIDKRAAQMLLNLMDPTAQPQAVNQAAFDAMGYLTGLNTAITTSDGWRQWWEANRDKSDERFRADLVQSRAGRYDAARQQINDLQDEIAAMLTDQYKRAAGEQRTEVIVRALRSAQPAFRVAGAKIAADAAVAGDFIPPAVKEQLRTLVGDSSVDVRRQVALALAPINDAEAMIALLTQLNQEPDSTVRAAIAQALAPIRDPRSVEPLLKLLDDPRVETAQAAAQALGEAELARRLRAENPALADLAADKLMTALNARTNAQNNIDLRHDLVRAIGPLQSAAQGPALSRLLGAPAEVPKVRRALLTAAGQSRLPKLANAISDWMDNADAGIRLAAVRALGQTANTFEWQNRLADRINPEKESEAEIRDAAWLVLSDLFKTAPKEQLVFWIDRFKNEPARRLVVLRILRDAARAAGDVEEVAQREQQMGDAAKDARQFDEAIAHYSIALTSAIERKKGPQEEFISESLSQSLLGARKYVETITFVQQQIRKDPRFQTILAPIIRGEAERLVDAKDFDNARRLIAEVLKMNPPLQQTQLEMLQELSRKIDNRTREQNLTPRPVELPLNARAD